MKRMIRLLTAMLALMMCCTSPAGYAQENTGEAQTEYAFSAPAFDPVLLLEYDGGKGMYDVKVFLTGIEEEAIHIRMENAGEETVSFSFSQLMLDDLAFYRYHDWTIAAGQTENGIIEIPKNALRWAGRETVSEVTLSTPSFHYVDDTGENITLHSQDLAQAKISDGQPAPLPEGMEILAGPWGSLRMIGMDMSGGDMEIWFRLDNALPSWTVEWTRGVTYYSYMQANVKLNSVNGAPVKGQAYMFQNWVCSSIDLARAEMFRPDGTVEEISMTVSLMGSGEDDDYDETVELTVQPDYGKLIVIGPEE